ncbi:MAG: hypothetical protein EPO68_07835 [Planctomycetota bacterium]|nr:MAG: hypothetical protein EPO68_07835 [Planctomycetota bacterium]
MRPADDLCALLAHYAWIDALLAQAPAALRTAAPAVSGWDAEHHVAHVALANELVLRNLHSLAAGTGALVQRGGEPIPEAHALMASGVIPRGRAQSPRMVRPPERVDPGLLAQWLAEARAGYATLDPASIVASEFKVPHQLLGPLDAVQWLRFGAVHTRHHLVIAREVLAAQGVAMPELRAPTASADC